MPGEVRVAPIEESQLEVLLPMIAAYQRFYEVADTDEQRNRAFFARFIAPSDDGMLLGAWKGERVAALNPWGDRFWALTLIPLEGIVNGMKTAVPVR